MSELNRMKLKQHGSAVMMYDEYPANAAWLNMLQMLSGCAAVQISLLYGECCSVWDTRTTHSLTH